MYSISHFSDFIFSILKQLQTFTCYPRNIEKSNGTLLIQVSVAPVFFSFAFLLPLYLRRTPGQPRTKSGENDLLSWLQHSLFVHLIEKDRDTGCGSVAVLLHIHRELFFRHPKPLCHGLNDSAISLMKNKPVDCFYLSFGLFCYLSDTFRDLFSLQIERLPVRSSEYIQFQNHSLSMDSLFSFPGR